MYTASQALFVIIVAELPRRGVSFQRLRGLSGVRRNPIDPGVFFESVPPEFEELELRHVHLCWFSLKWREGALR
jgi:hypothetical protein